MPVLSSHPFLLVHFHSHTKKELLIASSSSVNVAGYTTSTKNYLIDIN